MSGSPSIFLVDDDQDFLEMEKAILGAGGYRTRCFSDGQDALEALGRREQSGRRS